MFQQRSPAAIVVTCSLISLALLGPVAPATAHNGALAADCAPTITALPLPKGDTNGDVLSASGATAVGYVADDAQHQSVVVWRRSARGWSAQDLGDFGITEPRSGLSATGVNALGEVTVGVNTDVMGAWVYHGGVIRQLQDFAGGTEAYARAINDSGEIAGEALDASGNDFAAIWTHWWSTPVKLAPTAGYDGSFAQGINARGEVVGGSFSNGPSPTLPVRWSAQRRVRALDTFGADAQVFGINAAGRAVGDGSDTAGEQRAAVWNRSGGVRSLGAFPGSVFSRAIGVAANGDVVGFEGVNPPPPAIPVRHVLFWPGFGPTRSLLPLSLDWADGAYSHTLDDQGDVFGASSATHTSLPQPTEWTCALRQSFVPGADGVANQRVATQVRLPRL